MIFHLYNREEYPGEMPLPDWAADAASKIADSAQLVLLEGIFEGSSRILLARWSTVVAGDETVRVEFQPLGVVLDTELAAWVEIPANEHLMLYPLTRVVSDEDKETDSD